MGTAVTHAPATEAPTRDSEPRHAPVKSPRPAALKRRGRRENLAGYLFMSPWIAGFLLLTAGPMIASLYFAFTDYNLFDAPRWIGLDNFSEMFADPRWRHSVQVTLWYVAVGTPIKLIAALGVALLLAQKRRGQAFYRAAFYAPSLIGASVSVAIVWKAIFSDDAIVDRTQKLFGVDVGGWTGDPDLIIYSLVALTVWCAAPRTSARPRARRAAGVRGRLPVGTARRVARRTRRMGRPRRGVGGRTGRTGRAARWCARGRRRSVRPDRDGRRRAACDDRVATRRLLAVAARAGRPPHRARPGRVLPDRRWAGRGGLLRLVQRAARAPRPGSRRGGGRRRGGALPAPLTRAVSSVPGPTPGVMPLSAMPLMSRWCRWARSPREEYALSPATAPGRVRGRPIGPGTLTSPRTGTNCGLPGRADEGQRPAAPLDREVDLAGQPATGTPQHGGRQAGPEPSAALPPPGTGQVVGPVCRLCTFLILLRPAAAPFPPPRPSPARPGPPRPPHARRVVTGPGRGRVDADQRETHLTPPGGFRDRRVQQSLEHPGVTPLPEAVVHRRLRPELLRHLPPLAPDRNFQLTPSSWSRSRCGQGLGAPIRSNGSTGAHSSSLSSRPATRVFYQPGDHNSVHALELKPPPTATPYPYRPGRLPTGPTAPSSGRPTP